ncbi:hypothetical protein ACGF5C_03310 [Micromonospora sp. NPDC047620]|uniref:hypothetical protein n=1 Tax=Micromonospora sp. NPDC047620 TaxID=3364251 RepID=UPI00371FFCD4
MGGLELIVVLGVTVLVGTALGGRYGVAPPVLLITMGALLAFLPPLSHVVLEPEVVLRPAAGTRAERVNGQWYGPVRPSW